MIKNWKFYSEKRTWVISVSPVLGHVPPEEQILEGRSLRLSCVVVLGTPKPSLKWLKNNRPLDRVGNNIIVRLFILQL